MSLLGPLGFTAPWLLVGLLALPVLWLILRAVPPAPIRRRFPAVTLLLGLQDREPQTDRTPWWLLLIRLLAVAAAILAFAGPVLNPRTDRTGSGPLLILLDGTWADARDWEMRMERVRALLAEAGRAGRPVVVTTLTAPPDAGLPPFRDAASMAAALPAIVPQPWLPDAGAHAAWAAALKAVEGRFETVWLSDGLARDGREVVLDAAQDKGPVTVIQQPRTITALLPPAWEDGTIRLTARRTPTGPALEMPVAAIGPDPAGLERILASATLMFPAGAGEASVDLALPAELRNRVTRFALTGQRSAGAVTLTADTLRRREVGLVAGDGGGAERLDLLSPLHYLREALAPDADLVEGTLADVVAANPDAIILADVATLAEGERERLIAWVEAGGTLLRFAGPRLAATDPSRLEEDPLLPVRLRAGGRMVGGAMSWGEPRSLAPFAEDSPFFGLPVPPDVTVSAQVIAQPDPTLAGRAIAQLQDGTPLVTRKSLGEGQVVLFHVTANPDWSTLPLSGLFVQMLERLAVSARSAPPTAEELAGTIWVPQAALDAWGELSPLDTRPGIPGERLAEGQAGPDLPPGLYADGARSLAVNAVDADIVLAPAQWPASVPVEGLTVAREIDLKGPLLALALLLLAADAVASLALSGRLRGPRQSLAALLLPGLLLPGLLLPGLPVRAQEAAPPPGRPPLPRSGGGCLCPGGHLRCGAGPCPDRRSGGGPDRAGGAARPVSGALAADRRGTRRTDGRGYRKGRAVLFPPALLADHATDPDPLARGLCKAQPLSRHGGHDPVRHPRCRHRRSGRLHTRRAQAPGHRAGA
ncbi:N-terminal double-transmembrane domain protein [Rubellimicrobium thermophilum DSM 16684]|uniref:N-terminal double-transmembrane domain protein n=1 Tax=Rubellimicrobium thermophilum DSM 16684 TaxID=1123069 RepID=S9SMC9_9RHOB|nr:N-terminal double-transmembrane domain protein [Rubellimicrobium thermophilum DSM 16684]